MPKQKKLGFAWGENGISLVEVNKNAASAAASVSFALLQNDPVVGIKSMLEDVRLLELVQAAFRTGRFSTIDTSFSLPSKDVIVRWFVIPWVKPNEIQGVVVFEAKKYSPFPIEDLSFTYHPVTISKDGVRQLGILFVAIRKPVLAGYLNVLRQVGLNVIYTEPASMSLLRALIVKKLVDPQKITAILNFNNDAGEIIITGQGYVKFIRDFRVEGSDSDGTAEEKSIFRAKLFNEVKMSLDFFARQQSDTDVTQIVTMSSALNKDVWDGLSEDTGLPVRVVDPLQMLDKVSSPDIGHVHAFGAGLAGNVPTVVDLNLSEGQTKEEQNQRDKKRSYGPDKVKILSIGGLLLAAAAFAGIWVWTADVLSARTQERATLAEQLGVYADVPKEEIDSKKAVELTKLAAVKSLSFQSDAVPFIARLLPLIPEGVWFSDMKWQTKESAPARSAQGEQASTYGLVKTAKSFVMNGFVYAASSNTELQVINDFLEVLKADEVFKSSFKSISLGQLRPADQGVVQATAFTITCE